MDAPVIIAGAGPVGLSLGVGLAHHGIRSIVLEERTELSNHSKAPGIQARTLEIFRAWGLLDRFRQEGELLSRVQIWIAGEGQPRGAIDLSVLDEFTAVPGVMLLPQDRTEALLAERLQQTGRAELRLGRRVVGFEETAQSVRVRVESADGSPSTLECDYLAGCDGAHSRVRQQLGWHLEGKTYPARVMLADLRLPDARNELPYPRGTMVEGGLVIAIRIAPRLWRLIAPLGAEVPEDTAVSPANVTARVERLFGAGPFETVWASVFHIHCRTSPHFRHGRVLLAGDAAHINSPVGGQGMNSGIHDAHNLAWKLARALGGGEAEPLLASYELERRPVILTNVDRYTDLLTRMVLLRPLARTAFLRLALRAAQRPAVLRRVGPRLAMLDARYRASPLISGQGSLLGARAPDGDLDGADGTAGRLLDLAAREAALLLFDDGRLPRWDLQEIRDAVGGIGGVGVHRIVPAGVTPTAADRSDRTARIWQSWRAAGGLAALVRPDGHVGWMEQRPSAESLRAGVSRALGVTPR
jgi:2-polyprenyl-6-methoxyphenol hydroxylase-like FAD-dependent oxidoreductase